MSSIKELLMEEFNPGELFLGIAEDGFPLKLDLKEAVGPIFVIAQPESQTHKLLTLAASSCLQSSPDWQLTVVTEDLSAWREIKPDFAAAPDDPRLADRLAQMLSQKDGHNLLIVEGLEYRDQMPETAKQQLHTLLKQCHEDGNVRIIASVDPDQITDGIGQLLTTYYDGQLIFGITHLTRNHSLQPDEFLAAGMGPNDQALRFSLTGK